MPSRKRTSRSRRRQPPARTKRASEQVSAQKGINGGGAAGASTMGGADACRSALAAPDAIRARAKLQAAHAPQPEETTTPRCHG